MARKSSLKTKTTTTIGFETKLWLSADKVRNSMEMAKPARDNECSSLPSQNSKFSIQNSKLLPPPSNKGLNSTTQASDTPADLAAIFADVADTREADIAALTRAADALDRDPEFLADYAKGLVVEDVLRGLKDSGLSKNALAEKIGKSRQYLSKILDEDRRVNFTIETLAELSAALDLQLHVRLLPPNE
jgi:ribosome-binding protein aMBF1 (putative translation factor)